MQKWFQEHCAFPLRNLILAVVAATVLFVIMLLAASHSAPVVQETMSNDLVVVIGVHVKGSVQSPGYYELPQNSRVKDAVEAAGGLTDDADTDRINLARYLSDGDEIIVPHVGEEMVGGKVSINYATVEELDTLDGISRSLAEAIVEYREEHGGFQTLLELKYVSGIGDARYEAIQEKITL